MPVISNKKLKHLPRALKLPFFNIVKKYKNQDIIISFSGGEDSSLLLRLVKDYEKLFRSVKVFHFNHKIRTNTDNNKISATDRDELFARKESLKYGFEFICKEATTKLSSEKDARHERWSQLADISLNATVFTGHHKDDVVENVLMKIFRGCGSNGVTGLKTDRENGFCNISSPLMFLSKNEVSGYCKKLSIEHIVDESNFENDYSRNRVRNVIIPEIKKTWPDVSKKIVDFRETIAIEREALTEIIGSIIVREGNGYSYNFDSFSNKTQETIIFEILLRENVQDIRKKDINELVNRLLKKEPFVRSFGSFTVVFKSNSIEIKKQN